MPWLCTSFCCILRNEIRKSSKLSMTDFGAVTQKFFHNQRILNAKQCNGTQIQMNETVMHTFVPSHKFSHIFVAISSENLSSVMPSISHEWNIYSMYKLQVFEFAADALYALDRKFPCISSEWFRKSLCLQHDFNKTLHWMQLSWCWWLMMNGIYVSANEQFAVPTHSRSS